MFTPPGVLLHTHFDTGTPVHALKHPVPQSSSEHTQRDRSMTACKHHDPSTTTVDEGSSQETPVRRRSTIKSKVTQLRTSTKSLFSRSKSKKEDSRILQQPDVKQVEDKTQSLPVSGHTASLEEVPNRLIIRQPDTEVPGSPMMALFTPLPDSDEQICLEPSTSTSDTITYDNPGPATHGPEVMATGITDIPTPEPSPNRDLTSEVCEPKDDSNGSKKDLVNIPIAAPSPPDISSYFFGSILYCKIGLFTLAAAGLCIVAAPRAYRLLRIR